MLKSRTDHPILDLRDAKILGEILRKDYPILDLQNAKILGEILHIAFTGLITGPIGNTGSNKVFLFTLSIKLPLTTEFPSP